MANTGLKYASSVSDVTGVGTLTWSNPSNAVGNNTNDATRASFGPGSIIAKTSHYLVGVINFGLTGTDNIDGIIAAFRRFSTDDNGDGPVQDFTLRLSKNGTISGNDKVVGGTDWPVGTGGWSVDKGASNDTWGLSLVGSDTIGFAVAGAAQGQYDTGYITAFRATAYYTSASGLKGYKTFTGGKLTIFGIKTGGQL